jgi:uncharacterized protein (DUF1697 family)
MAWVVFFRGTNVGGHKRFQPSVLAKELAAYGVANLGAAGTLVVGGKVSRASLRAEILRRLPFHADLMICPAGEIIDLARGAAFGQAPRGKDVQRFLSVMAEPPRTLPRLPLQWPAEGKWEVKVISVSGRYAVSLWRRLGKRLVYPNEVVEKCFSVSATTRSWNTIDAVSRLLEKPRGLSKTP